MSPVLLGDLPASSPVPTGKAGMVMGTTNGEVVYTNQVPTQSLNASPAGGVVSVTLVPSLACYMRVMACTIWRSNDGIWSGADWGIRLSVADLDGLSEIHSFTAVHAGITPGAWQYCRCSGTFRVGPGSYTAVLMWFSSPYGYTQINYAGPTYQTLHAFTCSEGRL